LKQTKQDGFFENGSKWTRSWERFSLGLQSDIALIEENIWKIEVPRKNVITRKRIGETQTIQSLRYQLIEGTHKNSGRIRANLKKFVFMRNSG
jgi:hypothetical protein